MIEGCSVSLHTVGLSQKPAVILVMLIVKRRKRHDDSGIIVTDYYRWDIVIL
jgi:hypothetical protein